jgi:hypothetical protein
MADEVSWREQLSEEDFLDITITRDEGRIIGFVLNYAAVIDGDIIEICRYDTCHGHLHVHRRWLADDSPRDLENPKRPGRSYLDRLEARHADLHQNWRAYRARMGLKR